MSKEKLNNLLGIEEYSDKKFFKGAKSTKRTEVAKDILESADATGKVTNEKPKEVHDVVYKKLHNICSIDEFTEKEVLKDSKPTKRTDVAKDVLQEKVKSKKHFDEDEDEDDDCDCKKYKGKKGKYEDDDEDEKPIKGLTKAQMKLPEALRKSIENKKRK